MLGRGRGREGGGVDVYEVEGLKAVALFFSFFKFFVGGLHQGFKALCSAGGSHYDGPVDVGGLEGFLIFLRPDETQHGSVQELVLLL